MGGRPCRTARKPKDRPVDKRPNTPSISTDPVIGQTYAVTHRGRTFPAAVTGILGAFVCVQEPARQEPRAMRLSECTFRQVEP